MFLPILKDAHMLIGRIELGRLLVVVKVMIVLSCSWLGAMLQSDRRSTQISGALTTQEVMVRDWQKSAVDKGCTIKVLRVKKINGVFQSSSLVNLDGLRVSCAAVSPNGLLIALGSHDGSVALFDATTGEFQKNLNDSSERMSEKKVLMDGESKLQNESVEAIKFSGDGNVVLAYSQHSILVWKRGSSDAIHLLSQCDSSCVHYALTLRRWSTLTTFSIPKLNAGNTLKLHYRHRKI